MQTTKHESNGESIAFLKLTDLLFFDFLSISVSSSHLFEYHLLPDSLDLFSLSFTSCLSASSTSPRSGLPHMFEYHILILIRHILSDILDLPSSFRISSSSQSSRSTFVFSILELYYSTSSIQFSSVSGHLDLFYIISFYTLSSSSVIFKISSLT